MNKKILVIGSGGREHAIAWKLAQEENIEPIFVAPGNGGTEKELKTKNINIAATDLDALLTFAQQKKIDLTIVGPEVPLAAGIVDHFEQHNLVCFGPNKRAAQLESNKQFAKDFMQKYAIPTAAYQTFTNYEQACNYALQQQLPLVIKFSGLAAGKGVSICNTQPEVMSTLHKMFIAKTFGESDATVVIEAFLEGHELSYMIATDGTDWVPLATARDFKHRYENNTGPMTGGMGSISPCPDITDQLEQQIIKTIIEPSLAGLQQEKITYQGILYFGLMLTKNGPKVLEFNCRFGDPETQSVLARLDSSLFDLCHAVATRTLKQLSALEWKADVAVTVVLAADGYPHSYQKGTEITALPTSSDVTVFHAGTKYEDEKLVTSGGRVLCVTALSKNYEQARQKIYAHANLIQWKGKTFRKDIGDIKEH